MLLQAGDLALDTEHCLLHPNGYGGEPIRLTPMESRLLATLMESPDQVVSRAHLMRMVWQTDFLDDTRTLDVHIRWLRRKIEADPSHPRRIVTHRGQGYELRVDLE
jgi:two-component system phosphate regulon response regulator PhoB